MREGVCAALVEGTWRSSRRRLAISFGSFGDVNLRLLLVDLGACVGMCNGSSGRLVYTGEGVGVGNVRSRGKVLLW